MQTSDAVAKQSVSKSERCEYQHQWVKLDDKEPVKVICKVCAHLPTNKEIHEAESIVHLREILKPGDTVYTVLRHVSRSGMTRGIDCYVIQDNQPVWITSYVGHAIGSPQPMSYWKNSMGLKIGGCGMDMGFHVVYTLSRILFRDEKPKDGQREDAGYRLNQRWL